MRVHYLTLGLVIGCASTSPPSRPEPGHPEPGPNPSNTSSPPPPNPHTTEPLVCNEAERCRALPEELAVQCARVNQTVKQGTCGALKVLVIETDPQSVTFTSLKRYYDANDKLVAHQLFVNEYGRTITYGTLSPCPIQNPTPACLPK